jgi:hypothetical protein
VEFKLEALLDGAPAVARAKADWYPLWPDGDEHPWG